MGGCFVLNNIEMADNYLEKQYEAYAARKAAWEKARKLGKLKKKKNLQQSLAKKPENETATGSHLEAGVAPCPSEPKGPSEA